MNGLTGSFGSSHEIDVHTAINPSTLGLLWDGQHTLPHLIPEHRLVHFPTFPPTSEALKRAKASGALIVWTLHDLTWWNSPKQASFLGRNYFARLAKQAVPNAHIITPSEAVKVAAAATLGLPETVFTAIPNGISEAFLHAKRVTGDSGSSSRPYLLFVGTIEPRKNLKRILQAFEKSGLGLTHDFWLVGRQGWGQLPRGVVYKGVLTDDELIEAYQGAALTVLVSLAEGFGIPVLESLACGTPVLASKIPVFEQMHENLSRSGADSDSLRLVDPQSVSQIAHGMQQIAATRPAVDVESMTWAKSFTWQESGRRHKELYLTLLG